MSMEKVERTVHQDAGEQRPILSIVPEVPAKPGQAATEADVKHWREYGWHGFVISPDYLSVDFHAEGADEVYALGASRESHPLWTEADIAEVS